MTYSIRSVSDRERAPWQTLFEDYGRFYDVTLSTGAAEACWRWIHDSSEPYWGDVAVNEQGQLLGLAHYQLMKRSLGGGEVCYLSDLYVKPELRGKGLGRALIDHVIDFARTEKLPSVRWLTQQSNHTARQLYDRYAPATEFILYSIPATPA